MSRPFEIVQGLAVVPVFAVGVPVPQFHSRERRGLEPVTYKVRRLRGFHVIEDPALHFNGSRFDWLASVGMVTENLIHNSLHLQRLMKMK